MKRFIGILLLLTACARTTTVPPDNFVHHDIQTPTFTLFSFQKITDMTVVKIYIEGDGNSFDGRGMPTTNPTPRDDFMRNLAFNDPSPNVVYLARPCQYVDDEMCQESDWTVARFSANTIDATASAIKKIAGNRPVILIGFSGGAQIAGLVAAKHPEIDIKKIITVAGNLDHPAWTSAYSLMPLSGSLDLNNYRHEFDKIPQLHFIGDKDTVIPHTITINFVGDVERVQVVPGAEHSTGFDSIYFDIWKAQ
ncbi:MAG: serine hydrolase family protein [Alphaproteobacteria bacterium]|nr:serine hydrolase family protein [Alphaproteobacteria bacterium]MCL2889727.1 serine hydrolase family protein [Alphaproteobacteria bacterium]